MTAIKGRGTALATRSARDALGVSSATFYRSLLPLKVSRSRFSHRQLSDQERIEAVSLCQDSRFADCAPAQIVAQLLDEGRYLCSERTLYRLLAANGQVRERRDQLRHPIYPVPQLLAAAPNQLWSWDITKLLGPAKWTYFYLYMILDVFSRYAVGWAVAHRESAELAKRLIDWTVRRQKVPPGQLTLHADRGSAHYNAMLCLKALGRRQEAAEEETWYRYHKDDEAARAVTAQYRREHPYDNRESLPVHVHDEPRPPKAVPPAWLAEIGPKGYQYKGYFPPNELVLHDDRPTGARRPLGLSQAPHPAALPPPR